MTVVRCCNVRRRKLVCQKAYLRDSHTTVAVGSRFSRHGKTKVFRSPSDFRKSFVAEGDIGVCRRVLVSENGNCPFQLGQLDLIATSTQHYHTFHSSPQSIPATTTSTTSSHDSPQFHFHSRNFALNGRSRLRR